MFFKKIIIFSIFVLILSAGVFVLDVGRAEAVACPQSNVCNWAWSDRIGWVSFSSASVNHPAGVNYGVNINEEGIISGHAWSDKVGWISFNAVDLVGCPQAPCSAVLLTNNNLSGWARVPTIDGWISLSGSNYGVRLENSELRGWAWGGNIIGWISFSGTNYAVLTNLSLAPQVTNATNPSVVDFCHLSPPHVATGTTVVFNWVYSDPENNPQDKYEIRVSQHSHFPSDDRFDRVVSLSSESYKLDLSHDPGWNQTLNWATTYHWKVRVFDGTRWSDWLSSTFRIERTQVSPLVTFSYLPQRISINEVVEFDGRASQTLDGSTPQYSWTFTGGTPAISTTAIATTTFGSVGLTTATLRVTNNKYSCSRTENLNIRVPLPDWREIAPFGEFKMFLADIAQRFRSLIAVYF